MLEIRGLHKIYGKYHALSGLDMTVETGALYGFVGPNGAGKTTTIKIMTGLLEAEEGRITINGMDARADLGKLKSMIGYVPDFFGVYDNLTVSEYMEFFAACHHISGLDMMVETGALYGFVGPNGAGKTTTIKIMTGLLEAEEGRITINGMDARSDLGKLKAMIGYVPDFFGVYDNLTVSEYMEFFAACHHINGLVARKRYTALLEQVGLEDKLDFFVDGLSRGMKQRLCLARALIHDPAILVLDEPTSGLDPRTRFEFREILKELQESGKTIVISSHVLSELSELCTDIGIIDQGRMVLEGNIDDILSRVNTSNPLVISCLLYTSPSPRDYAASRMPSSA